MGCLDHAMDPVRAAHHANVTDEMSAAFIELRVGFNFCGGNLRGRANDEYILSSLAATAGGDVAHRLVGGDYRVGKKMSPPLGDPHSPVKQAALAELGLEHLGRCVVYVVDQPNPGQLERGRRHKQDVRRIAKLNDVETVTLPRLAQ